MSQGPNPKLFMLMAVGALVLGVGGSYVALGNLSGAKDELRALQAEAKDAPTLEKELADSKVTLDASSVKLQHLEQGVPDFAYIPTMLTELEKVGKASGIDVIGVRPMPLPPTKKDETASAPKRKAYQEQNIEVKGRGSYRSVMNFIKALGTFPKIVSARTVSLAPKTEPGQAMSLDVTIELRAYVFAEPEAPKAVKTAMTEGTNHAG